ADRAAARHPGSCGAGGAVRADPGPRRRGDLHPAAAAGRADRGLHLGGRGSDPGLLLQVPPLADLEVSSALETEVEETPRRSRRRSPGGGLGRYILVRFLLIIPTILILMTMVFFLMRITGDPLTAALGGRLTPEQLAERRAEAGYDRPLIVQYFDYLGGVLRGDFGTTYSDNTPVSEVLTTYGAATVELVMYSLVVALLLGVPLGMIAARTRDRWPDAVLRIIAILGYATPVFFVGLLLKLVFSVGLGWLPVAGRLS